MRILPAIFNSISGRRDGVGDTSRAKVEAVLFRSLFPNEDEVIPPTILSHIFFEKTASFSFAKMKKKKSATDRLRPQSIM
jgi:hypothetical protein